MKNFKKKRQMVGLLFMLLFIPFNHISAHVRFLVKYKIVEKTVLVDLSNTKLKWKDKQCITSDSACALVLEVMNKNEFTESYMVMADTERDAKMYGLIECERNYTTFVKSPTKEKGVFIVRQFVFESAKNNLQLDN